MSDRDVVSTNVALHGVADKDRLFESEMLSRLERAGDRDAFVATWLDIQCEALHDVVRGIVMLRDADQQKFKAVAVWPPGTDGSPTLAAIVETAIAQRQVVVEGVAAGVRHSETLFVAHPVVVDDELFGVVAIEAGGRDATAAHVLVEQIAWSFGWLEALARRRNFTSKARLVTVLELIATTIHHERFQASATAVATELATLFGCERVTIGFMKGRHIYVSALSHSAAFAKKTNLIRALEAAMDEAADQLATVLFPASADGPFQVTRAHDELARGHATGALCTIPLTAGDRVLGAIVLEMPNSGAGFDTAAVQLCEYAALLLGPVLDVKRREDRWLVRKALDSMGKHANNLIGPRYVALKLWTALATFALMFVLFAEGSYQVKADARLEGQVQRAITAALAGYIAETGARAGDLVRSGDMLATIDDRDLRLERLKWVSQGAQRNSEIREALAGRQRARVRVLEAQLAQAEAQISLIDEQLARTRIVAPFDAVVVEGDLNQSLGTPVERGSVLFELAPLEAYRVIMEVDERDINAIAVGQGGKLALTSMPNEVLPLLVAKITPVSVADQGRNYFRVEASVSGALEKLRPGMEGVGKINIEQRNLAWIWTRKLVHWLRMQIWYWWS